MVGCGGVVDGQAPPRLLGEGGRTGDIADPAQLDQLHVPMHRRATFVRAEAQTLRAVQHRLVLGDHRTHGGVAADIDRDGMEVLIGGERGIRIALPLRGVEPVVRRRACGRGRLV